MTNTLNKIMHNGDEYMLPRQKALVITLTSAGWSNNEQTVTATGVTANNSIIISPVPTYMSDYTDAKIYCSAQGTDSLTFTCDSTPASDIEVNVLILSAEVGSTPTPGGWQPGANTVAYYPFTTDTNDASGNGHDVTTLNNVQITTLDGVRCLNMNGSTCTVGTIDPMTNCTGWTISCWINVTSGNIDLQFNGDNFAWGGCGPRIGPNHEVRWGNETNTYSSYSWNNTGAWTHFVATSYNGVGSVYINGVEQILKSSGVIAPNNNGIFIMKGKDSDPAYGFLSNVIIEKQGWSNQDVNDYYDQTKGNYGIS